MTQRERILSIAVGGILALVVLQWGFNKYRAAVQFRQNRLSSLQNEAMVLEERKIAGAYADRQMGEYLSRSLPSDPDRARSSYQSWLLETTQAEGLIDASVDPVPDTPVGDLYRISGYRIKGRTTLDGIVRLLHRINGRDNLHRIRELNFRPTREGDLVLQMTVEAIALTSAPADAPPPKSETSWRNETTLADAREAVLNRNFFKPPNQPPRYLGRNELFVIRGQSNDVKLEFKDPEETAIAYELDGELPEWAQFDSESGRFSVRPSADETAEQFQVQVAASDSGYPRRKVTQTLTVKLKDAPPPEKPAAAPPEFDDSTQTYLTALLDGKEPMAWMNVRTRGTTLKLRIGDEFEIGTVRGKVVGMTSRAVELEIEGQRFELRQSQKLSDAITN